MIWTVVKIGWRRMRHGKLEMLLTFVVPIVFFTIFALIFDRQLGGDKKLRVRAVVVDQDRSDLSQELADELAKEATIRRLRQRDAPKDFQGSREELAARLVRRGTLTLAVVIPPGWARAVSGEDGDPSTADIDLLADTSNPMAPKIMAALVQRTASELAARRMRDTAAAESSRGRGGPPNGGTPTPSSPEARTIGTSVKAAAAAPLLVNVRVQDILAHNKSNPIVSMYAAGIAVMFLLFSATGNSGSLLEEEDNQTLERLMCSRLSMSQLLVGKWLWLSIVGGAQVTIMFMWAQLVFHVDLGNHLPGFAVMTLVTAAAASSFALFLAAACRTRAQLNAVSIIVILTMSALGGSMVPRYIMSQRMQEWGQFTFNAWALDGYMKVFWRDLPVSELWREAVVLGASALILLVSARVLARRWETE